MPEHIESSDIPSDEELWSYILASNIFDERQRSVLLSWSTKQPEVNQIIIESYQLKDVNPAHAKMLLESLMTQIDNLL
jgi:hypothetical protein